MMSSEHDLSNRLTDSFHRIIFTMNILKLPTEIVIKIFNLLNSNDLKICGRVCSNWRILALEVSEAKYKCMCENDFPEIYEEAYRKAKLSWEELHNSLQSWSQLKSCKVYSKYSNLLETRYVPSEAKDVKIMQFLSNGTIGYPYYIVDEWEVLHFTGESYKFNCICYYDAKTLELLDTVSYDYDFNMYTETDDMIVMRTYDFHEVTMQDEMRINIYAKPDKLLQFNKDLCSQRSEITINKNQVFYTVADESIWMSQLVTETGRTTIESFLLLTSEASIDMGRAIYFSSINNQVKVLTEQGDIFLIEDKKATKLCHIETENRNAVMDILQQHNFFWNAPGVYQWMCAKNLAVTHLKDATVYSYFDRLVIVGTLRRVLHIYYNPYRKGKFNIFKAIPTLRIDLNGWVPTVGAWPRHVCDGQRKINEIEVVEIKGGHRIILLYCQRLVAIELRTGSRKRPDRKSVDVIGMSDGEFTQIA